MTDVYFRLAGGIAEEQTVEELREAGVKEGTTTMTATVPQAQATEYAEEVGVVPTYAGPDVTVEGFLQFNGVDQGGAGNKYGIDVEFETTDYSSKWDMLSYSTP